MQISGAVDIVTSRLDYSNGLLYGIPKSAVSILQSVQNSAAHIIVTKTAPREHILHPFSKSYIGCRWTGELSIRFCCMLIRH